MGHKYPLDRVEDVNRKDHEGSTISDIVRLWATLARNGVGHAYDDVNIPRD